MKVIFVFYKIKTQSKWWFSKRCMDNRSLIFVAMCMYDYLLVKKYDIQ